MDDSEILEKLKSDGSYMGCVLLFTAIPAAVGAWTRQAPVVIALGAIGLKVGLAKCEFLAPMIKKKIWSNESFTESEFLVTLQAMQTITGIQNKSDAMYLLSQARQSLADGDLNEQKTCMPPRVAASMLLAQRG
jgi:hypothetical protein